MVEGEGEEGWGVTLGSEYVLVTVVEYPPNATNVMVSVVVVVGALNISHGLLITPLVSDAVPSLAGEDAGTARQTGLRQDEAIGLVELGACENDCSEKS